MSCRDLIIIAGLGAGLLYGCNSVTSKSEGVSASSARISATCKAIDGDTLRCDNGERLRLNGIDAPELPGHCRVGRQCAPGDPFQSTTSLVFLLSAHAGQVNYRILKRDHYGRAVVEAYADIDNDSTPGADDIDLSCYQLTRHMAIYVSKWDEAGQLSSSCQAAQ